MKTGKLHCFVTILLLLPLYSAHGETLIVHSGRPLTYAVAAVSEAYGEPVIFEESGYTATHSLQPLFPGAEPLYPVPATVTVDFNAKSEISSALQKIVSAAVPVLPERYVYAQTSNGVWGVVPEPGADPRDIPLDVVVNLPAESITTTAALDAMVAQVEQTLPNVELQVVHIPRGLSQRAVLPESETPRQARELLNEIAEIWTEERGIPDPFFGWQLRYGAGQSNSSRRVFIVSFRLLNTAPPDVHNLFVVESKHPMSVSAELLDSRFRVPITIEEPPALCPCELIGHPGTPNVAVRGGIVEMRWNDKDSLHEILLRLVDVTRIGDTNSGTERFKLDWNASHPILKPTHMRNEASEVVEYEPLLDIDLTAQLEAAPDTLTLDQVAAMLWAESGRTVVAGAEEADADKSLTDGLRINKTAGSKVTLQTLLREGVGLAHSGISFQLLYDPVLQGHRLVARRKVKE